MSATQLVSIRSGYFIPDLQFSKISECGLTYVYMVKNNNGDAYCHSKYKSMILGNITSKNVSYIYLNIHTVTVA